MKLITMISKFVEGSGYSYTTEYDCHDIDSIPNLETIDNSWSSELIEQEPEDVDYQFWYVVVDEDGNEIDMSEKFWVRK